MSKKDDGGSAFPTGGSSYNTDTHEYELAPVEGGMTLRDYFAAKAMQGLLAMCAGAHVGTGSPTECAKFAYEHADAMLAERSKP
jgi:hypothetical protein